MKYPKRATPNASKPTHQRDDHHSVQTPITAAAAWENTSDVATNTSSYQRYLSRMARLRLQLSSLRRPVHWHVSVKTYLSHEPSSLCQRTGSQQS
ncbi:hypothetical protein JCM18901_2242 [Psychrobacter sp. JCM 18901]|uniref:hypothetical protein n=1 Tax=Psychrobacter sp. JCM 18901 TaxID=1298609 RepID=UPI0004313F41|nr:hypothetical protein JCM18901_2242 [Psychrobacter sp. JCM 18901]